MLWTLCIYLCLVYCHSPLDSCNAYSLSTVPSPQTYKHDTVTAVQSGPGCPWNGLKGDGCAVGIKYYLASPMEFVW